MIFFNLRKVFYCFWIFFLLINIHNVFSQERKAADTTFFISYPDKIVIKANVDTQTDTYILRQAAENEKLEITPNNQFRLFFSLDYKFVGFSFGFAPKLFGDNDDDRLKGKSSFTDYKFHFFFGKFVQGLEYRRIKGYYVVNTGDFVAGWQENENPYI